MEFETIKYEVSEGIATITINRPDVLNALNLQVCAEVLSAAGAASADAGVGAVILTGAGRSFVAGADISQMKDFGTREGLAFVLRQHGDGPAFILLPAELWEKWKIERCMK